MKNIKLYKLVKKCAAICLTGIALFVGAAFLLPQTAKAQTRVSTLPPIKTVFIILEENHNWSAVKGSAAPYITNTLLPMGAHAENYHNVPTSTSLHPSEPNYVWLEAGSNNTGDHTFTTDQDPSASNQSTATDHLVTLLNNKGIAWKAYQEDISGSGCPTSGTGGYRPKHLGAIFFADVYTNTSYCQAHIRPFTELASDLAANKVSGYNFITPNLTDDMHDGTVQQGDAWLQKNIPIIMNSQAYKNGGLILITWDEGGGGNSPIGLIALSPYAKTNYSNTITYTHGSTLRTVEEIFGVSPFLRDANSETDLSDLFTGSVTNPSPTATLTPTGVVPTFVCGGSHNCVPSQSPTPTVTGNPSQTPSGVGPSNASITVNPSGETLTPPCSGTSSVQAHVSKHRPHPNGLIRNLIDKFLQFLMQLLKLLQQLLGGGNGGNPGPTPSITPSAGPSSSPSSGPSASPSEAPSPTGNPCDTPSPSVNPSAQPSTQPSSAPSTQPSASAAPSVSAQPSASAAPTNPSAQPSGETVTPPCSATSSVQAKSKHKNHGKGALSKFMEQFLKMLMKLLQQLEHWLKLHPQPKPKPKPSPTPSVSPSTQPSAAPSVSPSAQPSVSPSPSESPCQSPTPTTSSTVWGINAVSSVEHSTQTQVWGLPINPWAWRYYLQPGEALHLPTEYNLGPGEQLIISSKLLPQSLTVAQLVTFFKTIPAGLTVYYTNWHEPEDDIAKGTFTAAQYQAQFNVIRQAQQQVGNPNIKIDVILMGYDWLAASRRNPEDYMPAAGTADVLTTDTYFGGSIGTPVSTIPTAFDPQIATAKAHNLGWGVTETGVGQKVTGQARLNALTTLSQTIKAKGAVLGLYFDKGSSADEWWLNPAEVAAFKAGW